MAVQQRMFSVLEKRSEIGFNTDIFCHIPFGVGVIINFFFIFIINSVGGGGVVLVSSNSCSLLLLLLPSAYDVVRVVLH